MGETFVEERERVTICDCRGHIWIVDTRVALRPVKSLQGYFGNEARLGRLGKAVSRLCTQTTK
jgi:hypothetical protein